MYFTMEVSGLLEELNHSRAATAITDNTKKQGSQQSRHIIDNTSGSNTGDKPGRLEGVASNELISAATSKIHMIMD
jgi:hypothetical protein